MPTRAEVMDVATVLMVARLCCLPKPQPVSILLENRCRNGASGPGAEKKIPSITPCLLKHRLDVQFDNVEIEAIAMLRDVCGKPSERRYRDHHHETQPPR